MYPQTVSWIRRLDLELLAVGELMYSNDPRFFVSHSRHSHYKGARHSQVSYSLYSRTTQKDTLAQLELLPHKESYSRTERAYRAQRVTNQHRIILLHIGNYYSTLEYIAPHWSTLLHIGVHCSTLESLLHIGVYCSTLEYIAPHWSILLHIWANFSILICTRQCVFRS